jgi:hypothetical protein
LKKKASPMSMVGFPLLLIPLAIYNIIVFLMPGVSLAEPLVRLTLMSGAEWPVTLSDMLLALGMLLLLLEVIKGARPGAKFLTDHLLSLIVFGAAAAEFLLWPRFGTSTFFLLAMLALVDFLSGIALRARRGMPAASGPAASRREARRPAAATAEPRFDPAPAPSVPAAAPVAGSVQLDHPEPKIAHAEVTPAAPSPEVSSPGLQPSEGAPPSPDAPRLK